MKLAKIIMAMQFTRVVPFRATREEEHASEFSRARAPRFDMADTEFLPLSRVPRTGPSKDAVTR